MADTISPTSIATAEAFGTLVITSIGIISPTSIASLETFGLLQTNAEIISVLDNMDVIPIIIFKANLKVDDEFGSLPPYSRDLADFYKQTRSGLITDLYGASIKLVHNQKFVVSGGNAVYLKRNYTTGTNPELILVSEISVLP